MKANTWTPYLNPHTPTGSLSVSGPLPNCEGQRAERGQSSNEGITGAYAALVFHITLHKLWDNCSSCSCLSFRGVQETLSNLHSMCNLKKHTNHRLNVTDRSQSASSGKHYTLCQHHTLVFHHFCWIINLKPVDPLGPNWLWVPYLGLAHRLAYL